jgi:hypothetical protein
MTEALPAQLMPAPFDPDLIPPEAADPQDEEPLPEEIARWEVTDTGAAEWAMRLVAAYAAEGAAITDQANLYREQIDLWEGHELARIVRKVEFFRGHLERYALTWRAQTNRATLTLPSGEVKTTKSAARIQIVDEAEAMEWAQGLPLPLIDQAAPRKLSLSGIQALCSIEDRLTGADVYRSCGCIYPTVPTADGIEVPVSPGICPECGTDPTEVIQMLVTDSELVATYRDKVVPGLSVVPEHVNTKVKPR